MDPLHPILPGPPALPSRRVPAVERLPRVSRDGDRPARDPSERRPAGQPPPEAEGDEGGEGHIDVRV
jgi:hypothetical protein